jgi:hypothetical protein
MNYTIKEIAWQLLTERMPFDYNFEWKVRENKTATRIYHRPAYDVLVRKLGDKRGRVFMSIVGEVS